MISEIHDPQLGLIRIRRHANARGVTFRVSPKGILTATVRPRTSKFTLRTALESSRSQLEQMIDDHRRRVLYHDAQTIGKSHVLSIQTSDVDQISAKRVDRTIVVTVPRSVSPDSPEAQQVIQHHVIQALKREAKIYLTRRITHLADRYGYSYAKLRYTHTGTRWGSCSSTGTISLNIALMKLPIELIDYVLIHELCHIEQMNHSTAFWKLVAAADQHYMLHRRQLGRHTPSL